MRKSSTIALCLAFASVSLWSCKKNNDDTGSNNSNCSDNGQFQFLRVGNQLDYEYSDFFSNDTSLTFNIASKNAAGTYSVNLSGGGYLVDQGGNHRMMRECGDWLLIDPSSNEPSSDEDKAFPVTRTVGQTWTVGGTGNYKVEAVNVPVATRAGNFTADKISYHQTGAFNTDTIWFNNSIGYIKYDGFINS